MVQVKLGQRRRLGNLLVAGGLITDDQLGRALEEQDGSGDKLGSILVRLGFITDEQLLGFLSRQYRLPSVRLSETVIAPEVLRLVPAPLAQKHEIVPVTRIGGTLTVAMADPANIFAIDDVAFSTNLQILPLVATQASIRACIDRCYHERAHEEVMAPLTAAPGLEILDGDSDDATTQVDILDLTHSAEEAPVVKLVNMVLAAAIQKGASDIHFEPYEKVFRVRFRIDGMLHEVLSPPKRLETAILSRLKIMASLDISERRLPQDGRIKLRYAQREIDFRVSTLPTTFGEKAVLRILDKGALQLDLARLGFDVWSFEHFSRAMHEPYGMVLITGPTGSGKTTTLYSAIHAINGPAINIMTVEDPVEYNLRGVNQVQVNEAVGRTFAAVLRSFLRQDPDVILVGETRDLDTAQIAIRAALTGHLVFSTLHTNDCPSTVTRLIDMGVPPFLISSALLLIVAQRLGRRVCVGCRSPYQVDAETLIPYGYRPAGPEPNTLYRGKGCQMCNFTGMKGRVAIYEVMPVTNELRELILKNAPTADIRALARTQGMRTLREAGIQQAVAGVTTVDEVLRVTLS